MRIKNLIYITVATFFLAISCGVEAQDLVILHTNDTHSNIEPITSGRNAGFGGVQRRANYITSLRAENKNILLLDAGDYNQGTPYFTLFGGEVEIELMNAMGYDAVCLGNHEFDNGVEHLANRLKKAKYPTVCANYDFKGTALERVIKPYVIIKKGGKKIGIIGVMLDLKGYVAEKSREGIKYNNPIPVVNELADMLRNKKGCDLIIVLSHLGYDGGTIHKPADKQLAANTSNVDIIIGGHSHTFMEEPEVVKNRDGEGVIINQSGAAGVYVGRIDITSTF
ncbi:MAG: metallophosphoesterase [Bacteroidales bacterium]|jgi:5'-nucleotidase|nr:metallophosphoesterase [Bacteroidales bacterium]MDD4057362.1 metallophosphoesterase [Bacteroidales bacterium]